MKRFLKACLALACIAAVTTGCSSSSSAISKAGLGIVTSVEESNGSVTVSTTFATIGLDGDGKIVDINIDVAQSVPTAESPVLQSKKDLQDNYGMKSTSAAIGNIEGGAEWYQQAAAFEEYCKGKTLDEVAAIETETGSEGSVVAKSGSDLAAGCTISISAFQEAVAKAGENAIEVEADNVVMGYEMAIEDSEYNGKMLDTTVVMIAKKDDKIAASKVDVAQIPGKVDADTRTKVEKQDDYGMKSTSAAIGNIEGGAEWYQQAAAFEAAIAGMTADEVAAIETETNSEGSVVAKSGTDLAAGCTISIGSFQNAIANAMK